MTRSAGEVTEFAAGADGLTPLEIIERSIYFIRHQKVMVDFDLATLYQVPTKGEMHGPLNWRRRQDAEPQCRRSGRIRSCRR